MVRVPVNLPLTQSFNLPAGVKGTVMSLDDVETGSLFSKSYKPQRRGSNYSSVLAGIPPEMIEKAADREGVTKEKLVEEYEIVHHYDSSGRSIVDWRKEDG